MIFSTDLESDGFGSPLTYSRTWSGTNNSGVNGNGWVASDQPYLIVYSTFDPSTHANDKPVVAYIDSAQSITLFDVDGSTTTGTWNARFYSGQTLSYDSTTSEWTLIDAVGNKLVFNDLPRDGSGNLSSDPNVGYFNQGLYGKIKESIDSGGFATTYTYYTSGAEQDLIQTVERVDATTGQAERFEHAYTTVTNSIGGSAVLLSEVSLMRRDTSAGSFYAVRTATYDYYTGNLTGADAENGRLGDLKLVTIHDGDSSGDVIDQSYYRYYKMSGYSRTPDDNGATNNPATTGGTDATFPTYTSSWTDPFHNYQQGADNSVWSGLKSVVEGASLTRLAANYTNYTAASDAQIKPFVDHFFNYERWGDFRWDYETYANGDFAGGYHYYTRYHVTEELAQGAGCSTCSAGEGTYHYEYYVNPIAWGLGNDEYDPNVWRMRTIEYLPDTTNADTDSDGLVDSDQWADNDRYEIYTNEFGQVLLKVLVQVDDTTHGISEISRSSSTITVTSANHGLSTGDFVALNGAVTGDTGRAEGIPENAELPMYDGVYQVTVIDANTFTYKLAGVPDNTSTPDVAKMTWSKVETQQADYYRYNQDGASGSDYSGFGQLVLHANPSAVSGFDESYKGLVTDGLADDYHNQYLRDDQGLIELYTYYSTTTATDTSAGGVAGYLWRTKIKHGELDGGNILGGGTVVDRYQYFARTNGSATIYPVANYVTYRNTNTTSGAETTSFAYTWFSGTTRAQSIAVTLPTATTAQNGPNSGDTTTTVYDTYGRAIWTKDAEGYINYVEYDTGTGAVTKFIQDVNTSLTGTFSGLPSGWTSPSSSLHLTTSMVVDSLGRTTKMVDPNGNVTYVVYNDAAHEMRTYRGWNATTGTTTGPIEVMREYRPGAGATSGERTVYTETLTSSATPSVSGTAGNYVPTGTETIDESNIQSLERDLTNDAGQVIESDAYFSMAAITYAQASPHLGTTSNDSSTGNYHPTYLDYTSRGWLKRVEDPTGTVTRMIYDARGLLTQVWVGTDDLPTSGYWSPTNNAGANMVLVDQYEYDGGAGGGDGNLTSVTQYPGGGADPRVSQMFYDWRDRLVATKSAIDASENASDNTHFIYYTEYDNQDRPIADYTYDGDGVTIVDADNNGVPDKPSDSLLRAETETDYDNRGRVFRSTVYSVNPSTGSESSNGLVTAYWYDRRDHVIKVQSPGTAFEKYVYDGAGRMTKSYLTDAGGDSTWSDAKTVTGDKVLEQIETTYDANGNVTFTLSRQRFHDATGTGALGSPNSTGSVPKARVSYMAAYYDAADRLTDVVNVGTNGGSTYTRSPSIPTRSDIALVTSYVYDSAGRLLTVTDPMGIVTHNAYDMLGRTTTNIVNYVDGNPSDADDQTTTYTYNGMGDPLTMTAVLSGAGQTTQYIYGASQSRGDTMDCNNMLVAIRYPDKTTGEASADEEENSTFNALGERTSYTDRNGTTHLYEYDVLGRMTADIVDTLGAGVDGGILRIGYGYNTQGQLETITSYSDTAGTTAVNQILRRYNDLGQLTKEYQEHSGTVNVSTTPVVQYIYSEMTGGANQSRLTSMIYPNGKVLLYDYNAGVDDTISRLSSISESIPGETTTLETYAYLGLSTVVERAVVDLSLPEAAHKLSYVKLAGESNGDAGDQYTGLDRFGRVVDQRWLTGAGDFVRDRYDYGYDRDGNQLYRENLVDSAFSELYSYDGLNRLSDMQRGALNGTKNGLVGTPSYTRSWDLDALGNMDTVTTDGTSESRSYDAQNELTQVGSTSLAFDANGNLVTDQNGKTLVYDAWNRLVEQKDGTTSEIAYAYDGMGRRVKEGSIDVYFSAAWQVIEERDPSTQITTQYVWSPVYVDAMILRDRDFDGDGLTDERMYVLQDANWNVTALLDTEGDVMERFTYDAYGKRSALTENWFPTTDSGFQYGHQGGRIDAVTGRINFRNRDYDTDLMRWVQQDYKAGYADGMNLYQYEISEPTHWLDPEGLKVYLQSHEVEAGKYHASLRIVPNNQERYRGKPGWLTDAKGIVYQTIGAGPDSQIFFSSVIPGATSLEAGFNRPRDAAPHTADQLHEIPMPFIYPCEDQWIADLDYATKNFSGAAYVLFPGRKPLFPLDPAHGDGNSNSFISGLLDATGPLNEKPNPDGIFGHSHPGWNTPVYIQDTWYNRIYNINESRRRNGDKTWNLPPR